MKKNQLLIMLFSGLIGGYLGYTFADLFADPNYTWVRIKNRTNCDLVSASLIMPDRMVSATKEQMKVTLNPYHDDYDISIPMLRKKGKNEFNVKLDFSNCPSRVGDTQYIYGGLFDNVVVTETQITYDIR